jgi:hypothetical protein
VRPPTWRTHSSPSDVEVQQPPKKVLVSSQPPAPVGSAATFRSKTSAFYDVDFWNYSYGGYTLRDGKRINLTLVNSEFRVPDNSDSFSLKDVYYRDVTGDGNAEAIVWLSHVHCAGSCDGGSSLFYIYTERGGNLKPIWQYETGSYPHGCGLKSLTISGKQIVVELFDHCTEEEIADRSTSKSISQESTFIVLKYDGERLLHTATEFVITAPTTVNDYEPAIHIF